MPSEYLPITAIGVNGRWFDIRIRYAHLVALGFARNLAFLSVGRFFLRFFTVVFAQSDPNDDVRQADGVNG